MLATTSLWLILHLRSESFTARVYSKWGHNRLVEHEAINKPISLVLPVLTRPEVVRQAVAGIISGQTGLSLLNVEALLVLANAVGFVSLENTCVEYLSDQARHMKADGLLCLAQLADHLGLSSLLDTAADHLITLPWHENMPSLCSLLHLSPYTKNNDKGIRLLHHPRRGAHTELQVLAVLENLRIPRADCASAVELQQLQPAELQTLLAELVESEEDPGPLLRAAVKQQLVHVVRRPPPDSTKNVRIMHNIMLPNPDPWGPPDAGIQCYAIPESKFKLQVECTEPDSCGVFLFPSNSADRLVDIVDRFCFFALHPSQPYAREFRYTTDQIQEMAWSGTLKAGTGLGVLTYLSDLQKLYPSDYSGPFIIGIWWQDRVRRTFSGAD
ncbi:hypothetical protein ABBQ38_012458 [Trebouxia sp. C0009 RCD-2024]